ncbi:MAG: hypothetical protein JXQ91_15015 [Vannielia sp.]|uniref:hypothetical protein n=1 Tax=Vannielia sp. TaxID=2813045 RepID=UPI003B8CAFC6
MSLPSAWWAVVHGVAGLLALLLLGWGLWAATGGEPGLFGLLLRRVTGLTEPLLFALIALGALTGLHGRPHRATWVALTSVALLAVALGFLGYLLPMGQFGFFLATRGLAWLAAPFTSPLLLPLAVLAVLLWHLCALWQIRRLPLLAALLALAAALLLTTPPAAPLPGPFAATPLGAPAPGPLATPAHILPDTWMLPFYAILRALPHKAAGVVLLLAALAVWIALPWLDRHPGSPLPERPASAAIAVAIALCLLGLLVLGAMPPTPGVQTGALALTAAYFALFLLGFPLASRRLRRAPPPA